MIKRAGGGRGRALADSSTCAYTVPADRATAGCQMEESAHAALEATHLRSIPMRWTAIDKLKDEMRSRGNIGEASRVRRRPSSLNQVTLALAWA